MIPRTIDNSGIRRLLGQFPITALIGPRQCGKTTLAGEFKTGHYFDLENPRDLAALQNPQLVLEDLRGLIVIDEIQRLPEVFPLLRFLVDTHPEQRYLILGSASGRLLRQSSESLAGRIAYYRLGGLRLRDVGPTNFKTLWLRGGFPKSFTARNEAESRLWRDHYVTAFLERDIPQLGITIAAASLRRFLSMLAHYHGQIFNYSEMARSFGMSDMTVRRYVESLEEAFLVRLLQPWHANLGKRLVKRPKLFFADSGLFHALIGVQDYQELLAHPKVGSSWEGFAQDCILRGIGKEAGNAFFWATHGGAELDLFWQNRNKNWGIEFKFSDAPSLTGSMMTAVRDLDLEHLWVIYPGKKSYPLEKRVSVLPLQEILDPWVYS
jgi:predicted AAA+ superfamily ATPase